MWRQNILQPSVSFLNPNKSHKCKKGRIIPEINLAPFLQIRISPLEVSLGQDHTFPVARGIIRPLQSVVFVFAFYWLRFLAKLFQII